MLALRSDRRSLVVGKGVIRSMFAVFALSLLLSVAIDVEVRTVDGSSAAGTMAALDAEQVQLVHADASKSSLPMESVLSISRMPEAAAPKFVVDAMQVTLVCDSKLTARALESADGLVDLSTALGHRLQFDLGLLRSVRFNPPSALDQQWNDLLGSELVGDVVVIRRGPASLDYLEGVVRGFTADSVSFELDGELIEVPRRKLEGVVFFGRERPQSRGAKLIASDGSLLRLADFRLSGRAIAAKTLSGLQIRVPLNELVRIDFASGKVLYLGDVTPHQVEVGPAGPSTVQSRGATAPALPAPRKQQPFGRCTITSYARR